MRTPKRAVAAITVTLLGAALLSGCGGGPWSTEADPSPSVEPGPMDNEREPEVSYTYWQELPDGTYVLCVWASGYSKGGVSCNWGDVQEDPTATE